MKIVVLCFGTTGDVAPFTGVGARLQAAGHSVVIATHESLAPMVLAAGLEFRPLAVDVRQLLGDATGQKMQRGGSGAARAVRGLRQVGALATRMLELAESMRAASHDAEVIVVPGTTGVFGYNIAKAMGIPCLLTELGPTQLAPTGDFPLVNLGPYSFGRWGNRVVSRCVPRVSSAFLGFVKEFQRRLGVPANGLAGMYREVRQQQRPILHGFSRHILPRPAEWWSGVEIVGYWWPYRTPGWRPDGRLVDFLDAGPPPVYFGFGSSAEGQGERLSELVRECVRRARVRAVVQAGWAGLTVTGDDLLAVADVPYDWLFPRMAALVHHGGAGTTGAGLRAGVPAVCVPGLSDQPFWANRLVAAGVSPGWVTLKKITGSQLGDLVSRVVSEPSLRYRAEALAAGVRAEDGAAGVLDAVARLESGPTVGSDHPTVQR